MADLHWEMMIGGAADLRRHGTICELIAGDKDNYQGIISSAQWKEHLFKDSQYGTESSDAAMRKMGG